MQLDNKIKAVSLLPNNKYWLLSLLLRKTDGELWAISDKSYKKAGLWARKALGYAVIADK